MKILSDNLMNSLISLQKPLYAQFSLGLGTGPSVFGCRDTCSGSCDGSCAGDCEGSCAGDCEGSCAGDCEYSCDSDCEGSDF